MQLKFSLLLPPLILSGHLAAQITAPKPGLVRYPDGSVRAAHGLAGSLVPLVPSLGNATAIAFSDAGGLWATAGSVELVGPDNKITARYESGDSAPLLNMDRDPRTAVAWLPASNTLITWNGNAFLKTEVYSGTLIGAVTSVSLVSPKTARFLLSSDAGVVSAATVSLASGALLSCDILPGVRGPAFQFGSYVLSIDDLGLEIDSLSGNRRTVPLPEGSFATHTFSAERMSGAWIHLFSSSDPRQWALNLTDTEASLSLIPAVTEGGAR